MIKQISVGLMLSLSTMAYADDHASSTLARSKRGPAF